MPEPERKRDIYPDGFQTDTLLCVTLDDIFRIVERFLKSSGIEDLGGWTMDDIRTALHDVQEANGYESIQQMYGMARQAFLAQGAFEDELDFLTREFMEFVFGRAIMALPRPGED